MSNLKSCSLFFSLSPNSELLWQFCFSILFHMAWKKIANTQIQCRAQKTWFDVCSTSKLRKVAIYGIESILTIWNANEISRCESLAFSLTNRKENNIMCPFEFKKKTNNLCTRHITHNQTQKRLSKHTHNKYFFLSCSFQLLLMLPFCVWNVDLNK